MPMTIRARFDGRVFVPEGPVDLPVGAMVEVPVTLAETPSSEIAPLAKLAEIAKMFPEDDALPTDLAAQHDHYLYGTPKRPRS
jgi:hypothetical protein